MTSGCIDGRCDAVISNTSAPCAASVRPHTGPAMMRVKSRTLTGQRALGRGQGLNRRVADLIDAEEGQASDGAALRMVVPLAKCSASGHDETGLGSGRLQLLRLPLVESALHRRALVTAAE